MNVLLSTVGQRGYMARYFREELPTGSAVIGSGNSPHTPGFWSCDRSVLLPSIPDPTYLDRLVNAVTANDVRAVFTFSDMDLGRLAEVRSGLEELGVAPFFPGPEQATISLDKVRTHEFVTQLGLSSPPTTTTVEEALAWGPPLFIKPRFGSASNDVFMARTRDEIRFFMVYRPDMIAQYVVEGTEVNAEICCDLAGTPIRACLWRKHESRGGETLMAETIIDEAVLGMAIDLATKLRIPGPMDMDLIVVNGASVVIEINARFGGGYPISHLAGANFVQALVAVAEGRSVEPRFAYDAGVMMMKDIQPFSYPAASPDATFSTEQFV